MIEANLDVTALPADVRQHRNELLTEQYNILTDFPSPEQIDHALAVTYAAGWHAAGRTDTHSQSTASTAPEPATHPAMVRTLADLEALPVESVIRSLADFHGDSPVMEHRPAGWQFIAHREVFSARQIASDSLPAIVLHTPADTTAPTLTCTCDHAADGPDPDCQPHGMCAGHGHPCRCEAVSSR